MLVADDFGQRKEDKLARFTVAGARVNAGYTQGKIADKMGVSRATINAWENNRAEMKPHHVYAFCYIVGISENDLILPVKSTESKQGEHDESINA